MARRAERGVPGQRAGLATMRESGVIKRREIHPDTGPKLESTAQPRDAGDGIQLQVPHPWHLIAMKLHALRSPQRFETGVDLQDVKHLIKSAKIDTSSREFTEIAERYATDTIRSRLLRELGEQSGP